MDKFFRWIRWVFAHRPRPKPWKPKIVIPRGPDPTTRSLSDQYMDSLKK